MQMDNLKQLKGVAEVLLVPLGQVRVNDRIAGRAQLQAFHSLHVRLAGAVESMEVGHLCSCVEN